MEKVTLNVGGQLIELTLQQARELKAQLDQLFLGQMLSLALEVVSEEVSQVFSSPVEKPYWEVACHPSGDENNK